MRSCRFWSSLLMSFALLMPAVVVRGASAAEFHGSPEMNREPPANAGVSAVDGSFGPVPSLSDTGSTQVLAQVFSPTGRRCVEPTGEPGPAHPSFIRVNFYNQYGCKIPIREGKVGQKAFGYRHIVQRGEEQLAQGRPNSHEVTPFAQALWAAAIGRPGGSLLINPVGYFVASWPYTIRGGEQRTMCVFYATNDFPYGGRSYKVKGVITAFWILGQSPNLSQSCRDARE